MYEQRRYTPEGLNDYWLAVDASVKFWDKTLAEIMIKRQKKAEFKDTAIQPKFIEKTGTNNNFNNFKNNKYSWSRNFNRQDAPEIGAVGFNE